MGFLPILDYWASRPIFILEKEKEKEKEKLQFETIQLKHRHTLNFDEESSAIESTIGITDDGDGVRWKVADSSKYCNKISGEARMRIVGLTGGIGSGKSTVSNLFKAHGIPVVDADVVARDVLKKGTGGWKKVVAAFGDEILRPDGEVDRLKLGQIVFSDSEKRQLLNRLLAPYISSGIFLEVLKLWMKGCKVIVLDVPLLFEAKIDKWTKPIIVVWVDPDTQLQRLMARDGTSEEDAKSRINSQMSLDLKKIRADIVIDNTGSLEDLNENFQKALVHVTKPLTWTEFALSRQGAFLACISIFFGVIICRKIL